MAKKTAAKARAKKSAKATKSAPAAPHQDMMVSISGIRGVAGEGFTPHSIIGHIDAFARMNAGHRVVVGHDARPSGKWVLPFVEGVLRSHGVDVVCVGLCPTPTIAMLVRTTRAGAGLAITASHNPIEYNGLKFFHSAGEYFNEQHWKALEEFRADPSRGAGSNRLGKRAFLEDATELHIKELIKVLPLPERQRASKRPKVIIDCCNSAGVELAPDVADAYGALFQLIHSDPSKNSFPRPPEPLPEHLKELRKAVITESADLGFALDPDADRLALVDEHGAAIGEERTLLLAADAWLTTSRRKSPIVANLSSSRVLDDLAAKHRVPLFRTAIGEAHVLAGMKKHKARIGGEGNGGVIFPAVQPSRDAACAIALILIGLQNNGGTLSEWNNTFPHYVMRKDKAPLEGLSVAEAFARVKRAFRREGIDVTDGVKVSFADRWLHVRASNTEPIVRIFAEAPDAEGADELVARARQLLG